MDRSILFYLLYIYNIYIKKQIKIFFSAVLSQTLRHNGVLLSGKQPQVNRATYVSSHKHILNTTYTSTHNKTQVYPPHIKICTQF